jgi:hypothetical protein
MEAILIPLGILGAVWAYKHLNRLAKECRGNWNTGNYESRSTLTILVGVESAGLVLAGLIVLI